MKNKTKVNLLKGTVAAVALFSATTASAFSVSLGGTPSDGTGQHTTVAGAIENTFDGPLNFGSYDGGLVTNTTNANHANPPNDTSNYISAGISGGNSTPITISLTFLARYFGYYAGSPDAYNAVEFYDGEKLIKHYDGTNVANIVALLPNGDQAVGAYWNFFATGPAEYFNTIKLFSTENAFETDNHAVAAVPLPAAAWLFGSALLGFAGFSSRRKV